MLVKDKPKAQKVDGRRKLTAIERQYLATHFREARVTLGMSQDDVAKISGIQQCYISEVERAQANIGIDVLSLLAKAVGKEVYELLMPFPTNLNRKNSEQD